MLRERPRRSATVGGTFDVAAAKVDAQEDGEGEAVDAAFLDRYAKQRWEACRRARFPQSTGGRTGADLGAPAQRRHNAALGGAALHAAHRGAGDAAGGHRDSAAGSHASDRHRGRAPSQVRAGARASVTRCRPAAEAPFVSLCARPQQAPVTRASRRKASSFCCRAPTRSCGCCCSSTSTARRTATACVPRERAPSARGRFPLSCSHSPASARLGESAGRRRGPHRGAQLSVPSRHPPARRGTSGRAVCWRGRRTCC